METRRRSQITAALTAPLFVMLGMLAIISGCSSARTVPLHDQPRERVHGETVAGTSAKDGITNEPELMGPPEPIGPPEPPPPEQFGPEVPKARAVVLVLGPGLAHGFAHAGVIRALHEYKIPIAAVLGTEMGSLMAALYASNPNINQFDWALMRFNRTVLTTPKNVFSKMFKKNGKLPIDRELERAFGSKEIQNTPVPLRVAIEFQNSGLSVTADRGRIAEALRAALAVPGSLESAIWAGAPAVSAERSKPFLCDEARDLHLGPVVLVDVSGVFRANAATEKVADLVITPVLTGFARDDYEKATEISYRGKSAVVERIADIRNLLKEARE